MQIIGNPVLLVIDIQKDGFLPGNEAGIPRTGDFSALVDGAGAVVTAARRAGIPIVFTQEVHREDGIDIGRELDGAETMHCIETDPNTELVDSLRPQGPLEFHMRKRRYSAFFGTDLEILLRALRAETLILVGGLTNVCIHYTAVDAHQRDYHIRVVEDCLIGSSEEAHRAALAAMFYLQRDALVRAGDVLAAFSERAAVPA